MRALLLALGIALPAQAYSEALHVLITRRALEGRVHGAVKPPDVDGFRAELFRLASTDPEFRAAHPSPSSFTAWELKELMLLDPAAKVHGFDAFADEPREALALFAAASRWPDDDRRNRSRLLRDPRTHEPVLAPDGTQVPYDPRTLDFGGLTGPTSQAHAHYGLVDGPLSDDPAVLKREPRRFAVPPTAHAYARELAQLYTDLALLAASRGDDALAAIFAGAALHHLEDVCNQIHTVQVGIYEFFEAAFVQSKLRDLRTLGGLFGERRSLRQIGVRLIANHHLMSEDLFAARVLAGAPLDWSDDPGLPRPAGPRFAEELASAIIERSSLEAADVYRLAWRFSAPTLRDGMGHEYDGGKDDPGAFVLKDSPALPPFDALEARGVRRAATAVRAWQESFARAPRDPQAAVARILALVQPIHREAARLRASWTPPHESRPGIAWGYPLAAALTLALMALLALRRVG